MEAGIMLNKKKSNTNSKNDILDAIISNKDKTNASKVQQNLLSTLQKSNSGNKSTKNTKKAKNFKPEKVAKSVIKVNYTFEEVSKCWAELP